MKIHQIKITFHVTLQIKRYVYVYLLEGKHCYLIDSGVYGSERLIINYMEKIGRTASEIKAILLTHAHPDHIGTAAWFKENVNARIYAAAGERAWIEDIDLQYKERPIPNFYSLAGKSVAVDVVVQNGQKIELEEGLILQALSTPGHSIDEMSYVGDGAAFIGDSVPVRGDIPIYIDKHAMLKSLDTLDALEGISYYYPAWDVIYSAADMKQKTSEARAIIKNIDEAVCAIREKEPDIEQQGLVNAVCQYLQKPELLQNPLFVRTVQSHVTFGSKSYK